MSGLGMVLDIAKDALAAQQYGIQVTGHNIANVNTEGYSRQRVVYEPQNPAPYGGFMVGRGVEIQKIVRLANQFIDDQLMEKKSDLSSSSEMENYMKVLEGQFNETSNSSSLSTMITDFWNAWHDIANNPSGSSERSALYEKSVLLAEQFNTLDTNMAQVKTDLTSALNAGISDVNEITKEIAQLNDQIVGMEAGGSTANDLRDKRNKLVSDLSGYLDVKTFEQPNHSLTVITSLGCVLVGGNTSHNLALNGTSLEWEGSGGAKTDLTNDISNGKLGGWLDMRDEILPKYRLDLDALSKKFIWTVNEQHSQGVGQELNQPGSSVIGTYQTNTTVGDLAYGAAADGYVDYSGTFKIWIGDAQGKNLKSVTINLDSGLGDIKATSTLAALRDSINAQLAAQLPGLGLPADAVQASLSASSDALLLTAGAGNTFGFAEDSSNILAALGINTFFDGTSAGTINVNTCLTNKDHIAAAQIDSSGNYATGDNSNALAMTGLQYTPMNISLWTCDRVAGNTEGTTTSTLEDYYHSLVGSIGIKSASITRNRSTAEVMVSNLGDVRNSISAVSIDEEMTNLIAFQQAYTAAAKLITVADEMLSTLLNSKSAV